MGWGSTDTPSFLLPRTHELGPGNGECRRSRLSSSSETTILEGTDEPIVAIPPPTQPPVPSSSSTQRAEKRGVNLSPTEISTFKERLREAQPPGGYKPETAIAATSNTLKDRLPATVSCFILPHEINSSFHDTACCGNRVSGSPRDRTSTKSYTSKMFSKNTSGPITRLTCIKSVSPFLLKEKYCPHRTPVVANRLESMEVVNTSPVIRGRPSGSQSRRNGGTQVAMRKVEASAQRRRHERAILELVSQRFKLPIGKRKFSKIEVLSLGEYIPFYHDFFFP